MIKKVRERAGCSKGLKMQNPLLSWLALQNGCNHHEYGMSWMAKMIASGKYEPRKIKNPGIN